MDRGEKEKTSGKNERDKRTTERDSEINLSRMIHSQKNIITHIYRGRGELN